MPTFSTQLRFTLTILLTLITQSNTTPPDQPTIAIHWTGALTTHGLAVIDENHVLITESYAKKKENRRILRGELYGHESAVHPFTNETFLQPCGLALSADRKTLYICDTTASRIYTHDIETGKMTGAIDTAGMPWNLRVLEDSTIWYLTTDGRLHRRTPDGRTFLLRHEKEPVEFPTAFDLAVTADQKTIYITQQKPARVIAVNANDGSTKIITDNLANPEGIEIDENSHLYIADTGADKVYRITPATDDDQSEAKRTTILDGEKYGFTLPICIRRHETRLYITAKNRTGTRPLILTLNL